MKRLLAMLLALALLLSGLALAEETELEPVLEDVAVEAEVEAGADDASIEEADVPLGGEEAAEILIAAKNPDTSEIRYEISDYLYHLMVLMVEKGVTWEEIADELARR